ncbi:pilus assembly protein FlpE [Pengzhenrongella frigida]|uniref:Pilus assembly protein FlpE n=1 Tax=Pengzhenrongella frigida TaxID=1259133 RepID=A0A4Q5MV73_9MICO|nr:pilus assembly protein FlpE [Cellulomonas sp. HLT2-17]RYV49385.1 pilus assembly protein FlpE [Cellulomonas sp. HLT2-17]
MADGRLIGVVGARGGLGASSLAAALAQRLARELRPGGRGRRGRSGRGGSGSGGPGFGGPGPGTGTGTGGGVALVDLGAGGGIDVLLGVEGVGGLRWPDLTGARGAVSGAELTALLPLWSGVTVLSADRTRPGWPRTEVVANVLDALAARHDRVVLDLDRGDVLAGRGPLDRCGTVLVLAARDLRSVAGVLALRPALRTAVADVRLVVCGPAPGGLGVLELAHVVDLPLAASMRPQRGFDAALERGGGPGPGRRGPLSRAADRLAGGLA